MSKINKSLRQLKYILKDDQRKSLPRIALESMHSGFLTKELPIHYFTHLLYKKDVSNYKGYVGFKKGINIRFNVLPQQKVEGLNDKEQFAAITSNENINTPNVVATSRSRILFYDDGHQEIRSVEQLKHHLINLIEKNNIDELFIKPNSGANGINTFKINPHKHSEKIEQLYTSMESSDFIFQEVIQQHDILEALNSSSINTARMHVYYNGHEAKVVSGLLRVGVDGMVVDNGAAGGMFVTIDFDKWALDGKAQQHLKLGGKKFDKHPNSNIEFDGYTLPFKDETFELLKRASEVFKGKIIGWDVAFTPDGPIIIEGNDVFDIFMCQKGCRGLLNVPIYKEIFKGYV